jgi:hypothetical protein
MSSSSPRDAEAIPPSPIAPPEVRSDVFGRSYNEVLLFLKHEDDKINRVLTALAFLTAAAVALYIFSGRGSAPATLALRDSSLTAADFFFASFIIGLALALLSAIAALDPTSFYPRFIGSSGEPESLLYYRAIGQDELAPDSPWRERCADGEERWVALASASAGELRELLARSYHVDARRLSHRAHHKVYRFTECNTFVTIAVVSLALLGVARLDPASESLRWWVLVALLIAYSWSPTYDYSMLVRRNFPDVGPEYAGDPWRPTVVFFFIPIAVVSTLLLLKFKDHWPTLLFALCATGLVRLLSLHLRKQRIWGAPVPLILSLLGAFVGLVIFGSMWCR